MARMALISWLSVNCDPLDDAVLTLEEAFIILGEIALDDGAAPFDGVSGQVAEEQAQEGGFADTVASNDGDASPRSTRREKLLKRVSLAS